MDSPPDSPASSPDRIRLDQFLKLCGLADTGGQAKLLIQSALVQVNGETETRRRRQLVPGDQVVLGEEIVIVASDADSGPPAAEKM